jgi:hypothetical protein
MSRQTYVCGERTSAMPRNAIRERCVYGRRALISMRAKCAALVFAIVLAPTALYGEMWLPLSPATAGSAQINAIVFAVRGAPPGQLGYLQTIKYIDDGMRYVDPGSRFFISPIGEMCFRTRPHYPTVYYDDHYRNWCMHPWTVDRVAAGGGFGVNEVRLWCMHAYPLCAHAADDIANSISAQTIEYRQERAALESLIYQMGGNLGPSNP